MDSLIDGLKAVVTMAKAPPWVPRPMTRISSTLAGSNTQKLGNLAMRAPTVVRQVARQVKGESLRPFSLDHQLIISPDSAMAMSCGHSQVCVFFFEWPTAHSMTSTCLGGKTPWMQPQ